MKRTTLYTYASLALLLGLAACTQDELADNNRLPEGKYPVVIRATGLSVEAMPQAAPLTRASIDGDWQGVQTVALKMGDAVKEYTVTATYVDGYKSATLSLENDPHYWTSRDPITVSAWWPIDNADITQMPAVKVAGDQTTLDSFAASDFIAAIDQKVEFDEPKLTFEHRTALVHIVLTDYTEGLASVQLTGLSTEGGNPAEITPYDKGGYTYTALVAPQSVATGTAFITCTFTNGKSFAYKMKNNTHWQAGEEYTYTVSLAAANPGYTVSDDGRTYEVYNANGLLTWNAAVEQDLSINCTLTQDIDLTGIDWTPVGNKFIMRPYTGTFDGGGHTIIGLAIYRSAKNFIGLIGCVGTGGVVRDVKLENVSLSGEQCVGAVAGKNDGGIITGCSSSGKVNAHRYAGGVVGESYGGSIAGCSSSADITAQGNVGGVAGFSHGYCTVLACYATGNVTATNIDANVGGIVGWNYDSTITACYHATGTVTGQGDYVGNVAGMNNGNSTVVSCYWSGNSGNSIGFGTGEATQVDGTNVTWQNAVDAMNAALQSAGSEWRYVLTGALPTLKKQ